MYHLFVLSLEGKGPTGLFPSSFINIYCLHFSFEYDLEPQVDFSDDLHHTIIETHDRSSDDLVHKLQDIIMQEWMYAFGNLYNKQDYDVLRNRLKVIVSECLPLRFFLPGFPVKSPNKMDKVLGDLPDFAEFLAIRTLVTTIRKLQAIYKHGVSITILSDYHTFDQYIGVSEESYMKYHQGLRKMIQDQGADDVIELISLSTFPEFNYVPAKELSTVLFEKYGGKEFSLKFDNLIQNDPSVLNKYMQVGKFMLNDLKMSLPGTKSSKTTKRFIKNVARGMMAQGVALDNFLLKQTTVTDYIRLSIHHHHPLTGKLAIDLFKSHMTYDGILRTPWHHVVLFDSAQGRFVIGHKAEIEKSIGENDVLLKAKLDGMDWLYVKLGIADYYIKYFNNMKDEPAFEVSMKRGK